MHNVTVLKQKILDDDKSPMPAPSNSVAAGRSILSYMVKKNDNTLPVTLTRMTARDGGLCYIVRFEKRTGGVGFQKLTKFRKPRQGTGDGLRRKGPFFHDGRNNNS